MVRWRPNISILLTLTPDHLDRHASFEDYARAKARIFENQTERDAAVINADDPAAAERAPSRPQIFWFSRKKRVASGAFFQADQIIFRREGEAAALPIGAASEKIPAQLGSAVPFERAGTLERAVAMASERAGEGDTVLLAPACASFDQFENYEHRGGVFKQLVRALAEAPRVLHARGREI